MYLQIKNCLTSPIDIQLTFNNNILSEQRIFSKCSNEIHIPLILSDIFYSKYSYASNVLLTVKFKDEIILFNHTINLEAKSRIIKKENISIKFDFIIEEPFLYIIILYCFIICRILSIESLFTIHNHTAFPLNISTKSFHLYTVQPYEKEFQLTTTLSDCISIYPNKIQYHLYKNTFLLFIEMLCIKP